MAKKQVVSSDIIGEKSKITEPVTFSKPDEIIVDFLSIDQALEVKNLLGSEPIINIPIENDYTNQEYLEQVAYYSEELLVSLEGIFIGGHAAQIKDQLYVALNNYKNK